MARHRPSSSSTIGLFGRILRVFFYLIAIAVMTAIAYYAAHWAVAKRNVLAQRQLLEPYLPPPEEQTEEGPLAHALVYDLSFLWDNAGKKPIVVNVPDSPVWRYFVVKVLVTLRSPEVRSEIEHPSNAVQIQELLVDLLSEQTPETVRTPDGKARLKARIQTEMNHILGGDKITAVYFKEFIFQ